MTGEPEQPPLKWNLRRRAVGVLVCYAPVFLVIASAGAALVYPRTSPLGISLAILGLLVAALNVCLALRPAFYRWRYGPMAAFRNVSGLPVIATLFVVLAAIAGFGDWRAALLGFITLILDVGGLPWFLVATWRDSSIWDA